VNGRCRPLLAIADEVTLGLEVLDSPGGDEVIE
jgi:hypothetical protein